MQRRERVLPLDITVKIRKIEPKLVIGLAEHIKILEPTYRGDFGNV
tara:strand:- start:1939 stop:2076 length:138 start_codon:yes stop_codon:yes gene_type:complete